MTERARVRAHAEAQVLKVMSELFKPEKDLELLFLLRTEIREALVDPIMDRACVTCLEPLSGAGQCDWCGAR